MAEKGHVIDIKDMTGNSGGIIVGPPSGTGSSSSGSGGSLSGGSIGSGGALGAPAPSGDMSTIMVTISVDKTGKSLSFNIPCYTAMNLNIGDLVRFDTVTSLDGKTQVPVYIERIPAGVVATINPDNASGTITERVSNKTIPFYQAHLSDIGIKAGDNVKYTLIYTSFGEMAVNVQEA